MKTIFLFAFAVLFLAGCTQNKPAKTIEDLKAGIKGETTAGTKYAAFAQKAREEGMMNVAKLFESASKSEFIHASNHRKALENLGVKMEDFKPEFEVKTTAENLKNAIEGETYEVTTMYPEFLKDAKAEKADKPEVSFTRAYETEKKHQQLYTNALEAMNTNTLNSVSSEYSVCPVCGNTFEKAKAENCPICGTKKDEFIIM